MLPCIPLWCYPGVDICFSALLGPPWAAPQCWPSRSSIGGRPGRLRMSPCGQWSCSSRNNSGIYQKCIKILSAYVKLQVVIHGCMCFRPSPIGLMYLVWYGLLCTSIEAKSGFSSDIWLRVASTNCENGNSVVFLAPFSWQLRTYFSS